jgi:hypothetical protein
MKIILGAFTLALAAPLAAQTPPAADPHGGKMGCMDKKGVDKPAASSVQQDHQGVPAH